MEILTQIKFVENAIYENRFIGYKIILFRINNPERTCKFIANRNVLLHISICNKMSKITTFLLTKNNLDSSSKTCFCLLVS